MFLTCVRKELLHNLKSLRYVVVLCLFVCLVPGVAIVRTEMYVAQLADHRTTINETQALTARVNSTGWARDLGVTAYAPPQALSIFAAGLDNEMSRSYRYWNSEYNWAAPVVGLRRLSSAIYRYGVTFDVVFMVCLVCSLLGLLLVYDSVCGEREDGTLSVLLSGPVPRDTVVLGKIAAGLLTAWIPLLIGWGMALVYVLVLRRVQLTPDELLRVGLLVGASALYAAFFTALGIAVSCLVARRATAMGVCIAAWVVLVLTVPSLVPVMARQLSPVPAGSKLNTEIVACVQDLWKNKWPKWQETMIPGTEYANWDQYWVRVARQRFGGAMAQAVDKLDSYHRACVLRQIRVNRELSRLSPASLFVNASTHIAGTGMQDYVARLYDLDAFRSQFRALVARIEAEERRGTATDAFNPAEFPVFTPRAVPLSRVLRDTGVDLALLSGGVVLLLMVAYVAFLRYRTR
jgi:ABC-type transport system involved in multi-copper enzyme maturation permease subunit